MHEDAERFLEARYPMARVLTAWPASDELSRPYLGYVTRPMRVVRIEDFTIEEVMAAAAERSRFDMVLIFSTKYEPPMRCWRIGGVGEDQNWLFRIPSRSVAGGRGQLLGGRVVFSEQRQGQRVAVSSWRGWKTQVCASRRSARHEMAGVRFHH